MPSGHAGASLALADGAAPILLRYTAPYDWPSMRNWLAARAVAGMECVRADGYTRTARAGASPAVVDVRHVPERSGFEMRVVAPAPVDTAAIAVRIRRVFDLDRDPSVATDDVWRDPQLARLAARHPGLRIPGGWDPFELAVRAVLGQQVTVVAARQLATSLVAACGGRLPDGLATLGVGATFPEAGDLRPDSVDALRMPGARKATLLALARAAGDVPAIFDPCRPLDAIIAGLRAVKGIGDWTAHYVALRALRAPDAFPASDAGLLRGAERLLGCRPSPAALLRHAERWRPHRAYAAQVLWAEDGA